MTCSLAAASRFNPTRPVLVKALVGALWWFGTNLAAKPAPEPAKSEESAVKFEYDDMAPLTAGPQDPGFPGIDKIFKNPALQSGLASGADAVNRSIESLMESVFYSLLDNKLIYQFNDNVFVNLNLTRDVYSTTSGEYVVADRASFGPGFSQELGRIHSIPITFGAEAGVEVLDIYLTTDGKRVAEQTDLPVWRRTLNNWFGAIPILTAILPPSFNPNELYDPFHQLETPFIFPKSVDAFHRMPLGTIRSYGISGGVHLGIDLGAGVIDNKLRKTFESFKGLESGLPYTVFRTGNHRINVLKRSENLAWVGLTDLKRTGHSLAPLVGSPLYFLTGTIPYWKGLKVNMFPLDIEFSQALEERFDQLYAYDLTNPWAQTAYLDAIKGDFTSSTQMTEMEKKDGIKTGVLYLFTRNRDALDSGTRSAKNLAIFRVQREQNRSISRSKITDSRGTYYVLESSQDTNDEWWNILVGSEERKLHQEALLSVKKVEGAEAGEELQDIQFVFNESKNPIGVSLSLTIQDKFLTTGDLAKAVSRLEQFTRLPLNDVPKFDLISQSRIRHYEEKAYFSKPGQQTFLIHPMQQHLGDFSAVATIFIPTESLEEILSLGEPAWWEAFAKAYDQEDVARWKSSKRGEDFGLQMRWLPSTLLFPTRLLNIRSPKIDAIREISGRVEGLIRLSRALDPIEARAAFHKFFDSDYGDLTARALLTLIDPEKLPRSIEFYAKPKGDGTEDIKERFRQLNGKVVRSRAVLPPLERYGWLKERLGEFSPTSVKERRNRPMITKIQVDSQPDPSAEALPDQKRIRVLLHAKNLNPALTTRIFARVEQTGKMALGKLVLAETVFKLQPLALETVASPLGVQIFEFYLSGKDTPFDGFLYGRAMEAGGDFEVSLSLSSDGVVFSEERQFQFRLEDGNLGKAGS